MNVACLSCGRPFETEEVRVFRFAFPAERHCAVCREAEDADEAQRAAELRLDRSGIPRSYRSCAFDTFERVPGTGDALAVAMGWSRELRQHRAPGRGLLFHGATGSGKTHLAVAILREALFMGSSGLFINTPSWLQRLRDLRGQTDAEAFQWTFPRGYKLVVLDDLGGEHVDPWSRDRIYSLVNEREAHGALTLVTSNLPPGELGAHLGKPIASRLARLCQPVGLDPSADYRERQVA